jgi:hypothetical protein
MHDQRLLLRLLLQAVQLILNNIGAECTDAEHALALQARRVLLELRDMP